MPSKFQNLTSSCSCPACTPVWKGVRRNLVLVSFKIKEGQEEKKSRLVQRSWAGVLDVTCAGSVGGDKSGTFQGHSFFLKWGHWLRGTLVPRSSVHLSVGGPTELVWRLPLAARARLPMGARARLSAQVHGRRLRVNRGQSSVCACILSLLAVWCALSV